MGEFRRAKLSCENKNLKEPQWKNGACWKYWYLSSFLDVRAFLLNWMPVFMHSFLTAPAAEDVTVTNRLVSWPTWQLNLHWLNWLSEFLPAYFSFLLRELRKRMGKHRIVIFTSLRGNRSRDSKCIALGCTTDWWQCQEFVPNPIACLALRSHTCAAWISPLVWASPK